MTKKIYKKAKQFIELFSNISYRLVRVNEQGAITGLASCFLYQPDPQSSIIYVVTAGHSCAAEPGVLFIETANKNEEGMPLLLNAGKFIILYEETELGLDIAVSKLPVHMFNDVPADLALFVYRDNFIAALPDEAYGFAVKNNYDFIKSGDTIFVERYYCYELFMELERQEEYVNFFKLARPFQDDDFYRGASGAPIADGEGVITSILIGRSECNNYMRTFRLDNFDVSSQFALLT